MDAANSSSRHARSRTTRGTLYCGLYAADADDENDDDDAFDVIRRRSWSKEPHATW